MDATEIARIEVQNGFRQFDRSIEVLHYYLDDQRPFALRPALIQELQGIAVKGLQPNPGQFRNTAIGISQSEHQPPPAHLVPNLVIEMCDYVNDNLHDRTPFHIAAYIMWRHNWIHPFTDGNGRTSRTLSYLVLSIILGYQLPGAPTIPEQIQTDRSSSQPWSRRTMRAGRVDWMFQQWRFCSRTSWGSSSFQLSKRLLASNWYSNELMVHASVNG